jgi:GH15 family glucan-1,4-alpha-glucosidase
MITDGPRPHLMSARSGVLMRWRARDVAQAREIFEALLARRNHVGLLSEDLAPGSGELWGNFPRPTRWSGS